nr:ComEC/Rec2 family competence protein [Weissella diestrammenae]
MLAYRNIQYVIRLRSGVITNSQPKLSLRDWILSGIKDWHFGLVSWFECLPDGLRDYGETLLLGFTRPDFYDDNRGIRTAGLVHLFSISGFQVMLVYRSWRAFGRWVGIARETNLMMLQIGLVGLWLFAGGVISLIRPISLAILNTWREMHWLKLSRYDLFGWSLLFGVVIEPGVLQTLGGQLSYVLAFGLLWVDDRPDWQVSLLLGVMIVPYLIYHTYEWHPLALLVNLVAVPVFTWVILPVLVIGILAAKFNMILIVTIANQLIQWCQFLIANVGQVPGNLNFGAISLLSAGILVFLTVRLLEMVNRVRIFQIIGYLILLTCLAGRTFCGRVIFINVGQGDSTLFVMPFKRQIMLLDTGGTRMMPDSNNIKRLRYQSKSAQDLLRNLSGFGISRIDQLVLTHKDWDHIGNLGALAKAMPINEVIVPSGMEHDNNFRRMTRPLKLNIRAITDQDQKVSQLKIIHPLTQGTGENEHSLAGIGQFGPLKMVFTGDLDQAGEERILQNYDVPQIDVLKFGHHGSQTSTSDKWLSQLRPRIGIVSAGQNNRYRHPSQIVLQKARDRKMLVYNTQKHGMVEYTWFFGTSWWRTLYNGSDITDNSK